MTIKSIWLRRIHKWVGLAIGIQFLIWAISGTAMALLDMDEVAVGPWPTMLPPYSPRRERHGRASRLISPASRSAIS